MTRQTINMTDEIYHYMLTNSLREPELLKKLREETSSYPNRSCQISPEQGQFMQLLVRLIGARQTLEIGVFTGYSSLCVALALPPDGRMVACDVNEDYTATARRYWKLANVDHKNRPEIGPGTRDPGSTYRGW
jgi:predicted O-methyltransferase YrrM